MNKSKRIAICISGSKNYSETFIKAHIDLLKTPLIERSMIPNLVDEETTTRPAFGIKAIVKKMNNTFINKRKEKELKRFLTTNNIGLVLAEYGHMGVVIMDTCKKYNIPLVVHFHGFDAYKKDILTTYHRFYKEMFEYATAIIAVSNDMKQQLISLGAKAEKVHYNVYGVDVEKFAISSPSKSNQELLFVGRFVEKKAPYLALLAFSKVLKDFPNAKFNMVGNGILLDVCKNMAISLNIDSNVHFLGVKSHQEVSALMQNARAYIQHSITPDSGDSEGTPNSILEAMACALPVIATNHAGIKDVVVHNETGYLVNERDIDQMSEYMKKLLADSSLAEQMGAKGRGRIEGNYTMDMSITKLKAILNKSIY